MFGKKKDKRIPFSEWGDELVAALKAATSYEEREAVMKNFSTKCNMTARGIKVSLIHRGFNFDGSRQDDKMEQEVKQQKQTTNKKNTSSESNTVQAGVKDFTMSSREITDYIVVKGKSSAEVEKNVNKKMREGWHLYGSVGAAAFGMSPTGGNQYIQAMVKFRT